MVNFLIKTIFVLALTINGAVLSGIIGQFSMTGKTGFDAVSDLLAWLIGGAIVFLAAGLIVAIQCESRQLKRWAIVLALTAAALIAISVAKHYAGPVTDESRQGHNQSQTTRNQAAQQLAGSLTRRILNQEFEGNRPIRLMGKEMTRTV